MERFFGGRLWNVESLNQIESSAFIHSVDRDCGKWNNEVGVEICESQELIEMVASVPICILMELGNATLVSERRINFFFFPGLGLWIL